jgi:hypothetical protein
MTPIATAKVRIIAEASVGSGVQVRAEHYPNHKGALVDAKGRAMMYTLRRGEIHELQPPFARELVQRGHAKWVGPAPATAPLTTATH